MLLSPQESILIPAVLSILIVAASSAVVYRRHVSSTGVPGKRLPPSLILEAGLAADRFSSSRIVSWLRFILRHGHALFSVHYKIVPDVPTVERLLVKSHGNFDPLPTGTTMMKRIFGFDFGCMPPEQYAEMHHDFAKVLARDFVNETAVVASLSQCDIEGKVSSLISFEEKLDLQRRWEHSANIKVLAPDCADRKGIAELDMEGLLKALIPCISIPLMYGRDYLDRNPTLLRDLDIFATQAVSMLALGIPTWVPIKSFQQGLAARARLHATLSSFYSRLKQYHGGNCAEQGADMSDVSQTALDRCAVLEQHGVSADGIGHVELSMVWAQNINTAQHLFWFIFYIYSVPGLLELMRQEVSSSGAISTSSDELRQITRLDIGTLGKECLLLKSSFLETFRLVEESVMFRYVTHQVTLDTGAYQHELPRGSWLGICNSMTNYDPSIYARATEFVPDRFIEDSPGTGGKRTVTYKTLRPWGVGAAMCRGRTFAEKEIMAIAASIITLWDIEPVGGAWEHPGFKAGATLLAPKKDIRVRIKRRSFQ